MEMSWLRSMFCTDGARVRRMQFAGRVVQAPDFPAGERSPALPRLRKLPPTGFSLPDNDGETVTPQEGTPVPEREDLEKEADRLAGVLSGRAIDYAADELPIVTFESEIKACLVEFGKAQRERGLAEERKLNDDLRDLGYDPHVLGLKGELIAAKCFTKLDTALLREALESLSIAINIINRYVPDEMKNNNGISSIREDIAKPKARLSPKESGASGGQQPSASVATETKVEERSEGNERSDSGRAGG